jgi:hypothetical protein
VREGNCEERELCGKEALKEGSCTLCKIRLPTREGI